MNTDNRILVGNKPFMNYVTGVIMQFTTHDMSEVIIKSRGKFISRAVDVAEISVSKFLKDLILIKNICIDSETFTNEEGKEIRVSTIEILLSKV